MASDLAIVSGLTGLKSPGPLVRGGNGRTTRRPARREWTSRFPARGRASQIPVAFWIFVSNEPDAIGTDVSPRAASELLGDFIAMLLEPSA